MIASTYQKFNRFFSQHKTVILVCLIFLIIFCVLGLPFTQWGFYIDDFGNILHAKETGWRNVFSFFTEGDAEKTRFASNETRIEGFLCGVYRPLSFVYYLIQYTFFGTNPYAYYLVTISLHALAAALLFLIFLSFTQHLGAFFAALYFGFHPSLWCWLGWTSAQTYHIELVSLLLIFFALHHYATTHKIFLYAMALILFALTLFLKEQAIVLPAWLFLFFWLYQKESFLYSLRHTTFFSLPCTFYIAARLYNLPFGQSTSLGFDLTLTSFLSRQADRFYEFVSYATDLFGLSWLFGGHQYIKGVLILMIVALGVYFFIHNTKKRSLVFFLASIIIIGWPSIIRYHHPRYMYTALPFFILTLIFLKEFYKTSTLFRTKKIRSAFYSFLAFIVCFNASFLFNRLSEQEQRSAVIVSAFKELTQNSQARNCTLCFFALPFKAGCAQAVWLYQKSNRMPIHLYKNFAEINKDQLPNNPLFVTWDYEQNTFKII